MKAKFTNEDGILEAFETGFELGDAVTYHGKPATVKQIIVLGAHKVDLLIEGDDVQARVPAGDVTK